LIEAASKLTLTGLREECRRVEAAAIVDEDERYRRVHRTRHIRSWNDRHGVAHLSAQGTADDIARLMTEVDQRCADTVADAVTGEKCEIPGFGPIPVTLARQLSEDAILKILLTKGVDVAAVAHGGYTIPAHLRSALDVRDEKCIVPGCDMRRNLERDHRNSFGRTQVTKLDDLAKLCRHHHYLKTFCGYTYRGRPGAWEWIPPQDLDVDLTPLRKIITSARRC
jgi:hypothetical protein